MNSFRLRFVHRTAGTNKDFAERTHSYEQRMTGAIFFFLVSGANLEHFTALNYVAVYASHCRVNVLASPKVQTIIVKFVLKALAVLIQLKSIFLSGHHPRLRMLSRPIAPALKLSRYRSHGRVRSAKFGG